MNSRKKAWVIAVCFLAATVVTIAITVRQTTSPSGGPLVYDSKPDNTTTFRRPSGHFADASLRAEMVAKAMQFDDDTLPATTSTSVGEQRKGSPALPPVEEFTLTPPNPALKIYRTTLAARFSELAGQHMPSQVPMTVGNQNVVLRRSADDSTVFSTTVDFDWTAFAKEQQQRQALAATGRVIPIFNGRQFVRMETIEFVDPQRISQALALHQSIQFTPTILEGTGSSIDPRTELMITDLSVVADSARTWTPCTGGTQNGAWTFGTLVTAMINDNPSTHLIADQMVTNWLLEWTASQPLPNGLTVPARTNLAGLQNTILNNWPTDGTQNQQDPSIQNVNVFQAPMQLNAIVNRIDLGQASTPSGGELRFIFGFTTGANNCNSNGLDVPIHFNVIVEYGVPSSVASGCTGNNDVPAWAGDWQRLETDFQLTNQGAGQCNGSFPCGKLNQDLQGFITRQVVIAGADQTKPPFDSALDQIRTNEEVFSGSGIWQQRQFQLVSVANQPTLQEAPLSLTPDGSFNAGLPRGTGDLTKVTDFINLNQVPIVEGNYTVPQFFESVAFQGGSVLNPSGATAFWNGSGTIDTNVARVDFSENTCNGCHGKETRAFFQQVENDLHTPGGSGSLVSAFLVGCSFCNNNGCPDTAGVTSGGGLVTQCEEPPSNGSNPPNQCNLQNALSGTSSCSAPNEFVQDPVLGFGHNNSFGDISRRATYLSSLLGGTCGSDQLLKSLVRHKVTFSH
jgi:hypothetical protein